jgi:hypothetical protein
MNIASENTNSTGAIEFDPIEYITVEEIEKLSKENPNDLSFGTAIRRELLKRKRK